MIDAPSPVFGQLAALADAVRARMLLLLERQPLSVSEVCSVVQLPQSTVSRHLKVLVDEGWAVVRPEGTSRMYRAAKLDASGGLIWNGVRAEVANSLAARQDARRLSAVLELRRGKAAAFFSAAAADWDRMRVELFGANADVIPLLALLGEGLVVGDLGCGTGQIARTLAPFVSRVIGVDASREMLAAARGRAPGNVDFREAPLEQLPIGDHELDIALLFLVLHYIVEPAQVLKEASRVLRPGGRCLIVDMMPHDRQDFTEVMGHVWPGFSAEQITEWSVRAGLTDIRHIALPVDTRAKGPALFAVRTIKSTE